MYQKLIVVGRLGRNPEKRHLPSGDPVATFSLATDRVWNDGSGEKNKETTWFRVSAFGKLAETVHTYLSKGQMVLVEGRLRVDPETGGPVVYTRRDGTVGASFEIIANVIRFLGGGTKPAEAAEPEGEATEPEGEPVAEEIPFN